MKTIESARKKLQFYANKIEEHNEEIRKYIKETESNLVPILDSSIIGYDELEPIKYKMYKNVIKTTLSGITTDIKIEKEDDEYYITGWDSYIDGVKQDIAYNKRRIKAGYKVWYSANPNKELETISETIEEE